MNDQDRDLIAALAEGRLGTDAAEAAIARIESDPELSSEYTSQVAALEFLTTGAAPLMTSSERTSLHASLTEQLGLVMPPAGVVARKKAAWWAPVFGLATAAVVVVAVVVFPSSSSDQPGEMVAGDTFAVSKSVPESGSTAEAPAATEEGSTDDGLLGDGGISVYETDAVELDALLNEAEGADSTDEIQRRLTELSFTSTVDFDAADINSCIDQLSAEIPPGVTVIRVLGASVEDDVTIIHLSFDYGAGVEDGLSFSFDDCSLVRHADQG